MNPCIASTEYQGQTKSPPRIIVRGGRDNCGPWYHPAWKLTMPCSIWKTKLDFPLYRHGTCCLRKHTFDALPSGNGRLSGKNYWLLMLGSVRPASRPGRLFLTGPEGGFPGGCSCQALINPGSLFLFPTCIRPSRRAYIAICQVYCCERGLSSKISLIYGLGELPGKVTSPCAMA